MKQSIAYLVHTEYHLLIAVIDAFNRYANTAMYDVTIILKRAKSSKRLNENLDFSDLPFTVMNSYYDINLDSKLTENDRLEVERLLSMNFSTFIFFQEQNPVNILLINEFKKKGAEICLFQDGLKPYCYHTLKFSPSLILDNIKQNKWISKNGYAVQDKLSFLRCRKYAFLKSIDKVYLTHPDVYPNFTNKEIAFIDTSTTVETKQTLKKIFKYNSDVMPQKDGVIFYMNQPFRYDGEFELNVLKNLIARYPGRTVYIKFHPLTSSEMIEKYKKIENVILINLNIPAEIFILDLTNSIILSFYSSSLLLDNPSCKFYWMYDIKEGNNIPILKKVNIINPTKHIKEVKSVEEIVF